MLFMDFPDGSVVKNLPAMWETPVWSLDREDLLEGNGKPLQFLPGKSHGQRSLPGYSLGGHKRDMTE